METREDMIFKYNLDNYISPEYTVDGGCLYFLDYWNQYIECDARVFANVFREAVE